MGKGRGNRRKVGKGERVAKRRKREGGGGQGPSLGEMEGEGGKKRE